jgi:hypothetical protein
MEFRKEQVEQWPENAQADACLKLDMATKAPSEVSRVRLLLNQGSAWICCQPVQRVAQPLFLRLDLRSKEWKQIGIAEKALKRFTGPWADAQIED